MLILHAGLLTWGAARHSPAWDEPGHLLAGISHWQFGTFDLMRVNPPLVRMVAAGPMLFVEPEADWSGYEDRVGVRSERYIRCRFIAANGERVFWLHTLARWACIPFSLLGGWICFLWARQLYGEAAGGLATCLWCFSPNVLGHAQLITSDTGAAAVGIAAAYAFWGWLRRGTWTATLVAGAVLGLAELTKTTWILLFALWPLMWLLWRLPQRRTPAARNWLRELGQLALMLVLALHVLNLGYGFRGSFTKLKDYGFVSEALGGPQDRPETAGGGRNRFAGTWLGELPVPMPETYLMGIDLQKRDFEREMWSYLRREWRLGGWWYYYLYALGIKVPLGTSVLVLLAVGVGLCGRGYTAGWRDELVLLAPIAVVLMLVSSQTGFNHHLRYLLPVFPFAFIWMSKVARPVDLKHWRLASIAAVALVWSAGSSLWYYPHSLSYFNELVGGPTNGHAHLLNSNIDWGQDLLYLKWWLDKHPDARPLHLAYSNCYDASVAGIEYTPPPPEPQPGWHALSVSHIRNRSKEYEYFLSFEPVAMAGYSIYVYYITPDEANRVRRELGLPELASGALEPGTGEGDDQPGKR